MHACASDLLPGAPMAHAHAARLRLPCTAAPAGLEAGRADDTSCRTTHCRATLPRQGRGISHRPVPGCGLGPPVHLQRRPRVGRRLSSGVQDHACTMRANVVFFHSYIFVQINTVCDELPVAVVVRNCSTRFPLFFSSAHVTAGRPHPAATSGCHRPSRETKRTLSCHRAGLGWRRQRAPKPSGLPSSAEEHKGMSEKRRLALVMQSKSAGILSPSPSITTTNGPGLWTGSGLATTARSGCPGRWSPGS